MFFHPLPSRINFFKWIRWGAHSRPSHFPSCGGILLFLKFFLASLWKRCGQAGTMAEAVPWMDDAPGTSWWLYNNTKGWQKGTKAARDQLCMEQAHTNIQHEIHVCMKFQKYALIFLNSEGSLHKMQGWRSASTIATYSNMRHQGRLNFFPRGNR